MDKREWIKLSSRDKWDKFREMKKTKWACGFCGGVDASQPRRAAPMEGAEICCGHCGSVLTHRSPGGQSDPFEWVPYVTQRKVTKKCTTCLYEPEWVRVPDVMSANGTDRGRCEFPTTKPAIRKLELPSGVLIMAPMVEKPFEKHNCPAWRPKECAEKK